MSKKHKRSAVTDKERCAMVLGRFAEQIDAMDDDEREPWVDALEMFFDRAASEDAFGTEGQNDPRGDFRNGEWSMRRVEGLDK